MSCELLHSLPLAPFKNILPDDSDVKPLDRYKQLMLECL